MRLNRSIISRKTFMLTIENTNNQIIQLDWQPIKTGFTCQMSKMPQNGSNVIFVNSLRACLTLAIFSPTIQSIYKFNINTVDTRCASSKLGKPGNKDLDVLPEAGIDTCSQNTWIYQCFCQSLRLGISTEKCSQIVNGKWINIKTF